MLIMQQLSGSFTRRTNIRLNFVILPENELRQKVTEDVGLGSGKYDIVTIGTYDAPFWGKNGWRASLEPFFARLPQSERDVYDREDLLPSIRTALSYNHALFALPFYGESSMVFYRKDVFARAGLTMSEAPTWQQIYDFAVRLKGFEKGMYGIVLRGLSGWGQILAPFNTVINAFAWTMVRPELESRLQRAPDA